MLTLALPTGLAGLNPAENEELEQAVADEAATPVYCNPTVTVLANDCIGGDSACGTLALAYNRPIGEIEAISNATYLSCGGGTAKCQGGMWTTRTWHVDGEYGSGSGTVDFWVQCGDSKPPLDDGIICETTDGFLCEDGPEEGEGEFGCWHQITRGNPGDVVGECVDPVNPYVIFPAVSYAEELVYDVFEHAIVIEP